MKLEAKKYLFDMREASLLVREFAQDNTLDSFRNDVMLKSAIERQLFIIGEALQQLDKRYPFLAAEMREQNFDARFLPKMRAYFKST